MPTHKHQKVRGQCELELPFILLSPFSLPSTPSLPLPDSLSAFFQQRTRRLHSPIPPGPLNIHTLLPPDSSDDVDLSPHADLVEEVVFETVFCYGVGEISDLQGDTGDEEEEGKFRNEGARGGGRGRGSDRRGGGRGEGNSHTRPSLASWSRRRTSLRAMKLGAGGRVE